MRNWILMFLKALEDRLPPPEGHHSLTFARYGNASKWEAKLCLGLRVSDGVKNYFIDEDDLGTDPIESANRLADAIGSL